MRHGDVVEIKWTYLRGGCGWRCLGDTDAGRGRSAWRKTEERMANCAHHDEDGGEDRGETKPCENGEFSECSDTRRSSGADCGDYGEGNDTDSAVGKDVETSGKSDESGTG